MVLTFKIFEQEKEKDKRYYFNNVSYKDLFHIKYFNDNMWKEDNNFNKIKTYSNYQHLSLIKNNLPNHSKFTIKGNLYENIKNEVWCLPFLNFSIDIFTEEFVKDIFRNSKGFFKKGDLWFLKKNFDSTFGGYDVFPIEIKSEEEFYTDILNCIEESNKEKKYRSNFFSLQKGVKKPLLIDGRKYDMRVYLLTRFKNNKIEFFLFKKMLIRKSLFKYDPKSTLKEIQLTNTTFNKKNISKDEYNELTELHDIDDNIIGICTKFSKYFSKNNSIGYHLLGLDFIYDDNHNLYLLEVNSRPQLHYDEKNIKDLHKNFEYDFFKEFFEITFDWLIYDKKYRKFENFLKL